MANHPLAARPLDDDVVETHCGTMVDVPAAVQKKQMAFFVRRYQE
jgi:hypothetical protein